MVTILVYSRPLPPGGTRGAFHYIRPINGGTAATALNLRREPRLAGGRKR
jgi:hypothetical protein